MKELDVGGSGDSCPKALPIFRGYTVDWRLREFRKVEYGKKIEFIPFGSEKGLALLQALDDAGLDYNPFTGNLEPIR